MRYLVQSGAGEFSSFRVVVDTPGEAVRAAHDLASQGSVAVRIVDEKGEASEVDEFSRVHCGYSLSADDMDYIRSTCDVLMRADAAAGRVFYARLFEIAPQVRPLFAADLSAQETKLQDTLVSLVEQVIRHQRVTEILEGLGRRHVAYGAKPEHYGAVGDALLHTLATLLGPRFTPAVKTAWTALYLEVAAAMMAAPETTGK